MKSKKEIIQSVEYIFENTKRIHGNSEALDWQKIAIHKSVEYILSLPIDVPSEEEIEEFIISHPDNTGNFILGAGISAGFKVGAKWAIEQTIKRNGKDKL